MSRSPSFVIAYAMEIYNMNATQAYQYVQSKRLCINPNDSFKSQLSVSERAFEVIGTSVFILYIGIRAYLYGEEIESPN